MAKELERKYYELCYTNRIHEFSKIDKYNNWAPGTAKANYGSIDEFYQEELGISKKKLYELRVGFDTYNRLYSKYYNEQRKELFESPELLLKWFAEQNESCQYCGITQADLLKIVKKRSGNLTLNGKTKRSKGTLEIEKQDPAIGYSFNNCILACPFCNNAKSNLIEEQDWRKFFVPAMKRYYKKQLSQLD